MSGGLDNELLAKYRLILRAMLIADIRRGSNRILAAVAEVEMAKISDDDLDALVRQRCKEK